MKPGNFDFGGFINDKNKAFEADRPSADDAFLPVRKFLRRYGRPGEIIYNDLMRVAKFAAKKCGGKPGLLFTKNGGRFVGFTAAQRKKRS